MTAWGGEQVEQAVAECVAALRPGTGRDWAAVRAGRLEWDCLKVAEHIAGDLIGYAGQLAGRVADRYAPYDIGLDDGTDAEGALAVIATTGALLAAAVRTASRDARGFHPFPFRSADREGFAAMGIVEVLVHTHDIAEGLGLPFTPPGPLVEDVLARIFPHVRPGEAPWPTLLWATGRGELPGREPLTRWHWYNNPALPAERITLHGVTPAAARDLAAGGDGGFDWVADGPYEGTRDAAGMVVKAYEAGVLRPEWGMFVEVRHDDGLAVGGIGFHGAPEDGRVEIGYDLAPSARGQGYATEALRTLSGRALAHDDVQVVIAVIDDDNKPSQGVVTRAGFTRATTDEERTAREQRGMSGAQQLYVRRGQAGVRAAPPAPYR
ncbi:GNAT family N-acetyltransferase [Streptomyces thermocoprophilus]|uniref:GNAT family N-acetyltransferase n=1 Tax=Streptomyces thermocoprophilus TaxID=78356 RepID=A0ABV5VD08_9ACTN